MPSGTSLRIGFRMVNRYVLPLEALRMTDVGRVGGKNASLGELISQLAASGVRVPGGFATTAQAFDDFLAHNQLAGKVNAILAKVDVDDVTAPGKAAPEIRAMVEKGARPPGLGKQGGAEDQAVGSGGPERTFAVAA